MLWLYQRTMFGQLDNAENRELTDLAPREVVTLLPLVLLRLLDRAVPGADLPGPGGAGGPHRPAGGRHLVAAGHGRPRAVIAIDEPATVTGPAGDLGGRIRAPARPPWAYVGLGFEIVVPIVLGLLLGGCGSTAAGARAPGSRWWVCCWGSPLASTTSSASCSGPRRVQGDRTQLAPAIPARARRWRRWPASALASLVLAFAGTGSMAWLAGGACVMALGGLVTGTWVVARHGERFTQFLAAAVAGVLVRCCSCWRVRCRWRCRGRPPSGPTSSVWPRSSCRCSSTRSGSCVPGGLRHDRLRRTGRPRRRGSGRRPAAHASGGFDAGHHILHHILDAQTIEIPCSGREIHLPTCTWAASTSPSRATSS